MQQATGTTAGRCGVFAVDAHAALAELELTWSAGGYHGFSADDGTWSARPPASTSSVSVLCSRAARQARFRYWFEQF